MRHLHIAISHLIFEHFSSNTNRSFSQFNGDRFAIYDNLLPRFLCEDVFQATSSSIFEELFENNLHLGSVSQPVW